MKSNLIISVLLITSIISTHISTNDTTSEEKCIANDPCLCFARNRDTLIDYLIGTERNVDSRQIYEEIFDKDFSQVVDCSNRSLRNIPKFKLLGYSHQPTVDCLDLSRNDLDLVSESLFYGLILRCIDFSYNSVTKISRNTFKGLFNSLSILKLNNNQIKSESAFPAYFISKLSILQILDMSSNRLEKIPDRSFQTMFAPSLRMLDLSDNTINCISDDAFEGAVSITYLNLCHNNLGSSINQEKCTSSHRKLAFLKNLKQLEDLQLCSNDIEFTNGMRENFRFASKLRVLNLANNKLKSIEKLLCSLKNLNTLNLASNEIEKIEANDLNCLSNLNELYLQSNRLNSIEFGLFGNLTSLRVLRLEDNPGLLRISPVLNNLHNTIEYISMNVKEEKFEEIVDNIVLENELINLKTLNLSHSVFSKSHLNLATLLLNKNNIRNLICHNCSIRQLSYKYDFRNFKSNEANSRYILFACERELNHYTINIDLNSNKLDDCHLGNKHKIENISSCLVDKLLGLINIGNLYVCKDEPRMFRNFTVINKCKSQQINCSLYYKKVASKWVFSGTNALFTNFFLIFLHFIFSHLLVEFI